MAVALALAAASGCGGDGTTAARPSSTASVHNTQDVAFASGMVPHHQQAVAMSDLVLERAASAELTALARQIKAAQGPEIERMTGWLREWGEPVPGEHGLGHGAATADGMLDEQAFAALDAATGTAFARSFLEGMIGHHEGAVDMAQEQLAKGQDVRVKALAQAVISGQTAEIALMKRMLAALG